MKVKTIMMTDPACCAPGDALAAAARIMWDRDCGVVPVVDPVSDHLVGVLTDRDICMAGLSTGRSLHDVRVRDIMTPEPASCSPDDHLREVHALMRESQVRRIPVVDEEGALVGIVSLSDLAVEAFGGRGPAAAKRQRDAGRTLAAICARSVAETL
jgi:CBS domain-containing protein